MPELGIHNLTIKSKRRAKRVGRGNGSGRGTYSGRGLKGQRARSGGRGGLKRKGLMQMLRSKPKVGGFKSKKPKFETINLDDLQKHFEAGDKVDAKKLLSKGLILAPRPGVKILGAGVLSKKLTVFASAFSETAKEAILKAGGAAEVVAKKKRPAKQVAKKG